MSRHRKHLRHISHSNENNDNNIEKKIDNNDNKNSSFDINSISELINNINPDELNSLLANFNLDGLKNVNQDEVVKKEEANKATSQSESKDNSKRNTTFEFLTALKPLVSFERGQILDKMLQIYSIGTIFKK